MRIAVHVLGAGVALATGLAVRGVAADATGATLTRHLALLVAAGLAWAAAVLLARRLPLARAAVPWIVALGLLIRLGPLVAPPLRSDDVWRYLWEARVQRAGENPFVRAPDDPALAGLRDDAWARVNHRQLVSLYPPGAQLLFRLGGAGGLAGWKALLLALELAAGALLLAALARRRGSLAAAIAWWWCPLLATEGVGDGHLDAASAALALAALVVAERRTLAGALVGLASSVKLLPLAVLPAWRSGRAALAGGLLLALTALPFASAGPRLAGSLGEYGRRWRGNDGAYALLQAGAEVVVAHTRFARPVWLGAHPRLARLVTGRDRDEVYPDEAAALLARGAAGLLWAAALAFALRRRASPLVAFEVVAGGFVLLAPVVHPWYGLFLLPPLALAARPRPAWLWLLATLPLAELPLAGYRADGIWHDPMWTRLVEHGVTWALLVADLVRYRVKAADRT